MLCHMDGLCFQVLSVGEYRHKDGEFAVKGRPFATLSLRVFGTAEFLCGGKSFVSRPGDALFLPAGEDYSVIYSGAGSSIAIHLKDCSCPETEHIPGVPHLSGSFSALLHDWAHTGSQNRAKAAVYGILAAAEETLFAGELPSAAVRFLRTHFREPGLTVPVLCRAVHCSESTLRRGFRRAFGVTPRKYLEKLRLDAAIVMLSAGENRVREIAAACGFADEKYFSRLVRARFGCPPTHFFR